MMKLSKPYTGILAFMAVLLTMPLRYAVMIIMEKSFGHAHVFKAAILLGLAGVLLLVLGSLS